MMKRWLMAWLGLVLLLGAGRAWAIQSTTNEITYLNGTLALVIPFGVPKGGTGVASWTANNSVLLTGTSGTGAVQVVAGATAGNVLVTGGAGVASTFTTINLASANAVGASVLGNANGGTNQATFAIDTALVATAANTWAALAFPTTGTNGCAGVNDKLQYNTTTHVFACNSTASSSFPLQLFFGTNGDISNASNAAPVYANLTGGLVDTREAAVQGPVNSTTRAWNNLRCVASGVPGGTGLTITVRKGACGVQAPSGLTCTIAAAATVCTGEPINSTQSVVSAGHCVDAEFKHASAAGNTIQVGCSVEQTA